MCGERQAEEVTENRGLGVLDEKSGKVLSRGVMCFRRIILEKNKYFTQTDIYIL